MSKLKAFLAWFNPFNDVSHIVEVKLERDEWKRKYEWKCIEDRSHKEAIFLKAKRHRSIAESQNTQIEALVKTAVERDKIVHNLGVQAIELQDEYESACRRENDNLKCLVEKTDDLERLKESTDEEIKDLTTRIDVQKENIWALTKSLKDKGEKFGKYCDDADNKQAKIMADFVKEITEKGEAYRKSLDDYVNKLEDKLSLLQESGNKEEEELEEKCEWFKEKNIILVKEVASTKKIRDDQAKKIASLNKEIRVLIKKNNIPIKAAVKELSIPCPKCMHGFKGMKKK